MTNRPNEHEPLDALELELAALLRESDPVRGPDASLDQRILAMAAHDVSSEPLPTNVTPLIRKTRWPQIVGLAATVTFASFILWRYNAVDEFDQQSQTVSNEQVATVNVIKPLPPSEPMPDAAAPAEAKEAITQAKALPPPPPYSEIAGQVSAPPPPQPPVVFDDAAPIAMPAPPPAPPVAVYAPAPLKQESVQAATRQLSRVSVTGAKAEQRSAKQMAAEVASAPAQMYAIPDVSMDDDNGPAQWLENIQARAKRGDARGARESLRLYLQRYPSAQIPPELERYRP